MNEWILLGKVKVEVDKSESERSQVELTSNVEEDISRSLGHGILFTNSNIRIIEMMPTTTMCSICSIVTRSSSCTMMYYHRS